MEKKGNYAVMQNGAFITGTRMTLAEARNDSRANEAMNADVLMEASNLVLLKDVTIFVGPAMIEVEFYVIPDDSHVDGYARGDQNITLS